MRGNLILLMVSVVAAGLFVVGFIVGVISVGLIVGTILYVGTMVGGVFYLMYAREKDRQKRSKEWEDKTRFDVCWRKANQILTSFEGGKPLRWDSGLTARTTLRTFTDGKTKTTYRSLMGYTSGSDPVIALVIYDVDKGDIAAYRTVPYGSEYKDPFYNFKPFAQERTGGIMDRFGSRGRYPRSRWDIGIGRGHPRDDRGGGSMIDDRVIDDAAEVYGDGSDR